MLGRTELHEQVSTINEDENAKEGRATGLKRDHKVA